MKRLVFQGVTAGQSSLMVCPELMQRVKNVVEKKAKLL